MLASVTIFDYETFPPVFLNNRSSNNNSTINVLCFFKLVNSCFFHACELGSFGIGVPTTTSPPFVEAYFKHVNLQIAKASPIPLPLSFTI
jgi:hypothetical protein